jgi:hypothetical protein
LFCKVLIIGLLAIATDLAREMDERAVKSLTQGAFDCRCWGRTSFLFRTVSRFLSCDNALSRNKLYRAISNSPRYLGKSIDEGAATLVVSGFDPGLDGELLFSVQSGEFVLLSWDQQANGHLLIQTRQECT